MVDIHQIYYLIDEIDKEINKLVMEKRKMYRKINILKVLENGKILAGLLMNHPHFEDTQNTLLYANNSIQTWRENIDKKHFPKIHEVWPTSLPSEWEKIDAIRYFTTLIEGLVMDIHTLEQNIAE